MPATSHTIHVREGEKVKVEVKQQAKTGAYLLAFDAVGEEGHADFTLFCIDRGQFILLLEDIRDQFAAFTKEQAAREEMAKYMK